MDIFDGAGKPNIEHASTDVATPSMGGGANDPAQLAVKLAAEVGTQIVFVTEKRLPLNKNSVITAAGTVSLNLLVCYTSYSN
jgi:hypothetical protein